MKTINITIHRHAKPAKQPAQSGAAGVAWVSVWDRKVLLLLRGADGPNPGTWCFPGGKVEKGETRAEAAVREFREETRCWNAPAARQVTPVWQDSKFSLYLYFGSKFGPILDGESDDAMWASLDNPPQPLHPHVREQIDAIKACLQWNQRNLQGT